MSLKKCTGLKVFSELRTGAIGQDQAIAWRQVTLERQVNCSRHTCMSGRPPASQLRRVEPDPTRPTSNPTIRKGDPKAAQV